MDTAFNIGAVALLALAAAVWLIHAIRNAPTCICGRDDCGGGCGLR